MADREIVLWLEEWWYDALSHHLKNETLEEHLENVLDELCDQLPKQDYERISREIQEQARVEREAAEAARTYAAYHVMENGKEYYFTDSGAMATGTVTINGTRTPSLRQAGCSDELFHRAFLTKRPDGQP